MEFPKAVDPVEFLPEEVTLTIFNYLRAKDLLNASMVSKGWYSIIGNSTSTMKKIPLTITCSCEDRCDAYELSKLAKSARKYENLNLERCADCIDLVKPLFQTMNRWRRVKLRDTKFYTTAQALQMLSSIQKTVEVLTLSIVVIKADSELSEQVTSHSFPKLQKLKITDSSSQFFEALERVKSLKSLKIEDSSESPAATASVIRMLKGNRKLEDLKIHDSMFNDIFKINIAPEISFQLTRLNVSHEHHDGERMKNIERNFSAFLKTQNVTLAALRLDWIGIDVVKTVYGMSNIKTLLINRLANAAKGIEWEHVRLPKSHSITELNLINAPNNLDMLKTFITASNSESLRISFRQMCYHQYQIALQIREMFRESIAKMAFGFVIPAYVLTSHHIEVQSNLF